MTFIPLSFYRLAGSNAAINISRRGEETEIKYLVTNNGPGIDSYKIETTPIDYELNLYVNNTFIQNIPAKISSSVTSPLLANLPSGSSRYIGFKYTLPVDISEPYYDTMFVRATSLNNPQTTKQIPSTLQDP